MATYRTAQGKHLDMAALAARNEKTRAVGNAKLNARGDTIDSQGKVIVPVTNKVSERYVKTVGNKSAQPVKQTVKPVEPAKPVKPEIVEELTEFELELEENYEEDLEVEKIKAKETRKK